MGPIGELGRDKGVHLGSVVLGIFFCVCVVFLEADECTAFFFFLAAIAARALMALIEEVS